jgi:hypothetical protein
MRRETKHVMSHRPYAVDLSSLRENRGFHYVNAVWFRRRHGVTAACFGNLHTIQTPAPTTAREFLERYDDGRYGGHCEGRWDGERYWGAQEPELIAQHLESLRPMLDAFPNVPDGYDGWWRF